MPGRPRQTLLACGLALVLGGCGSGNDGTIPKDDGENLVTTLDAIESSLQNNNCELIGQQAVSFANQVDALPDDVDPEVKKGLEQGAQRLLELSDDPDQCGEVTGATITTSTESSTTSTPPPEETTTSTTSTTTTSTSTPDPEQEPPPEDEGGQGDGPPVEVPGGGDPGSGGRGGGTTESGGLEGGKR